MGTGKGIFPGRVTWVRDTAATPWDGITGHWWEEGSGVNQAAVDRMMSRSLRGLTGAATDAGAWKSIFEHYNQGHGRGPAGYRGGETIAVKINCNNTTSRDDVDNQIDATPPSVLALLRQLIKNAGVPPDKVMVYDASRAISDRIYGPCHAEYPAVLWLDAYGGPGRQPVESHANAFSYATNNSGCGNTIPEAVYRADYLVNMALMKGHNTAGVSLTAKNHYGSIDQRDHQKYVNASAHPMGIYHPFVDLIGTRQLGGKTILFMIDGLYGVRTLDDQVGHYANWNNLFCGQWLASYFMSLDPVAIDSVALDFLRSEFGASLGAGASAHADNYLHEAALAERPPSGAHYAPDGIRLSSLGVHEHWNNATNRQYSRNLHPDAQGIELLKLHEITEASMAMTSPTNGTQVDAATPIILRAEISNGAQMRVGKVDFFRNGWLIGSSAQTPFEWVWNDPPPGSWQLTATATDATGLATVSAPISVSIAVPADARPGILHSPADQTVVFGDTAVFHVDASGGPSLQYQWLKDGIPLEGATTDELVLTNVRLAQGADYAVVASNAAGSAASTPARLTILAPTALTQPAITNGDPSFVLSGGANPNGLAASAFFQWGPTLDYGHESTHWLLGWAPGSVPLSLTVTGLPAGMTFHFRLATQLANGAIVGGEDLTFSTSPGTPEATTQQPSMIGTQAATLRGLANPSGLAAVAFFEYGTSTSLGWRTESRDLVPELGPITVGVEVTNLDRSTLYYACLVVSNALGVARGDIVRWATGTPVTGTALGFDGKGTLVIVPESGGLNGAAQGTIEMWVRWEGTQSAGPIAYGHILSRENGVTTSDSILGLNATNPAEAQIVWYPFGAANPSVTGMTPVGDGLWHHVAVAFDGWMHRLFMDGKLEGEALISRVAVNNPYVPLAIGEWSKSGQVSGIAGALDEVRIWTRPLSRDEIAVGMKGRLTGREPGLATYLRLDEGSGSTAADSSGNHHDGALAGGPSWVPSVAWDLVAAEPIPATLHPTGVSAHQTTLQGMVCPQGLATAGFFEYGTGTNLTWRSSWLPLGNGFDPAPLTFPLTNLLESTAYSVRLVVTNEMGTALGQIQNWSTPTPISGTALCLTNATALVLPDSGGLHLAGQTQGTIEMWLRSDAPVTVTNEPAQSVNPPGPFLYRSPKKALEPRDYLGFDNADPSLARITWKPFAFSNNMGIQGVTRVGNGIWRHVAVTYDPSGVHRLYLDGELEGSASVALPMSDENNSRYPLYIGGLEASSLLIDELRFWNRARSQEEIRANMKKRLTGYEAGLLTYLRLDEGSGDITRDDAGNQHDGMLANRPIWMPSFFWKSSQVPEVLDQDPSGVGTQPLAPNAWVNPNGLSSTTYFEYGATTNLVDRTEAIDMGDGADAVLVGFPFGSLPVAGVYYGRLVASNAAGVVYGPVGQWQSSDRIQGTALLFNGAGNTVSIPGGGGLNGASQGTIEMWVRWDGPQVAGGGFLSRQVNSMAGSFANNTITLSGTNPEGAKILWYPFNQGTPAITSLTPVGNGIWHHVAVTFAEGEHRLYVDGALEGAAHVEGSMLDDETVPLRIGGWDWWGVFKGFSGVVDEVRIWNVARSAADIQASMAQPLTGNEPGLITYLPMNEGTGVATRDASGNHHDGLLANTQLWTPSSWKLTPTVPAVLAQMPTEVGPQGVTVHGLVNPRGLATTACFEYGTTTNFDVSTGALEAGGDFAIVPLVLSLTNLEPSTVYYGWLAASNALGVTYGDVQQWATPMPVFGTGLSLDGTNTCLKFPGGDGLGGLNQGTIELWFRWDGPTNVTTNGFVVILSKQFSCFLGLDCSGPDGIRIVWLPYGFAKSKTPAITGGTRIEKGVWYHLAITFDPFEHRMYLDGNLEGIHLVRGVFNDHTDTSILMGWAGGRSIYLLRHGDGITGVIDEVRIWNTVRSAAEIQTSMAKPLTGHETGLTTYLPLDDRAGLLARDATGNQHHGVLSGGPLWIPTSWAVRTNTPALETGEPQRTGDGEFALAGCLNPRGLATTAYYEFGTNASLGSQTAPAEYGAGFAPVSLKVTLTHLDSGTVYYARLVASNALGISYGNLQRWTTPTPLSGAALKFDGTGADVSLAEDGGFDGSSTGTIELWVEWEGPQTALGTVFGPVVSQEDDCTIYLSSNNPADARIVWNPFSGDLLASTTPAGNGVWHHVAATFGEGLYCLYVDGILEASREIAGSIPYDASTALILGGFPYNNRFYGFSGSVDEVRIWTVRRSGAEIQAHMGLPLTGNEPGLAAYYRLDEGYGGMVSDSSGNRRDALLFGAPDWVPAGWGSYSVVPTVQTASPTDVTSHEAVLNGFVHPRGLAATAYFEYWQTSGVTNITATVDLEAGLVPVPVRIAVTNLDSSTEFLGRLVASNSIGVSSGDAQRWYTPNPVTGSALGFLGGGACTLIANGAGLNGAAQGTLEAWVRWTGAQTAGPHCFGPVWSRQQNGNFLGTLLGLNAADPAVAQVIWRPFGQSPMELTGVTTVGNGIWHHVAVTFGDGQHRLYLDGFLEAKEPLAGNLEDGGTLPLSIGGGGLASPSILTSIDEFRIWTIVRTQAEIRAQLYQPLAGDEPGLDTYLRLDDGVGLSAHDASGHGHEGTLRPGAWPSWVPLWIPSTWASVTSAPTVVATAPTGASDREITWNAYANPHGSATSAHLEYGPNTNLDLRTEAQDIGGGFTSVSLTVPVANQGGDGVYYARWVVSNALGVVYGPRQQWAYPIPVTGTALKYQNARSSLIRIPDGGGLRGVPEGTIELWVRWDGAQQNGYGGYGWAFSANNGLKWFGGRIGLNASDPSEAKLTCTPFSSSYAEPGVLGITPVGDGLWRHVAVTFDGHQHQLYLDGVLEGTAVTTSTLDALDALFVGGSGETGAFIGISGAVDEVRLWNIARSEAEIRSTLRTPLTGNEPGLITYLRMDECTGNILHDASGHFHDGWFDSAPLWIPSGNFGTPPVSPLWILPTNQIAFAGTQVKFTLVDSAPEPRAYQWQWNGVALAGETNQVLMVTNVRAANAGEYTVAASNGAGTTRSSPATLLVRTPTVPSIGDLKLQGLHLSFSVLTETGIRYVLECKDRITDPGWRTLNTMIGDGTPAAFSDSNDLPNTRFYRIRLDLP